MNDPLADIDALIQQVSDSTGTMPNKLILLADSEEDLKKQCELLGIPYPVE